jgi:hypothetical protein
MLGQRIDRRFYELCVLSEVKNALRSGNLWIPGSRQFKDFEEYLIPPALFQAQLVEQRLGLVVETECARAGGLLQPIGRAARPQLRGPAALGVGSESDSRSDRALEHRLPGAGGEFTAGAWRSGRRRPASAPPSARLGPHRPYGGLHLEGAPSRSRKGSFARFARSPRLSVRFSPFRERTPTRESNKGRSLTLCWDEPIIFCIISTGCFPHNVVRASLAAAELFGGRRARAVGDEPLITAHPPRIGEARC